MIFCGGFSKRKYIWGYNYDLCRANKETGLVLRLFNIILYHIQRQILISILGYFLTVVGAPRFTFLKTTTEGRRREYQFSPLASIIYFYNIWHEAGIRILVCCRVVWAIMLDLGFKNRINRTPLIQIKSIVCNLHILQLLYLPTSLSSGWLQ